MRRHYNSIVPHGNNNQLLLNENDWVTHFKPIFAKPKTSTSSIYFNRLSVVDEQGVEQVMELSLYQRQEISRVLMQCKDARTPSIRDIWDQLSHIFDDATDPFKDALKDKLMLVGYLNDQYILNMPPSNPYGLSYEFLTTHIKETDIGKFSELISTLLVELADEGEVLRNSLVNDLRVLLHKRVII